MICFINFLASKRLSKEPLQFYSPQVLIFVNEETYDLWVSRIEKLDNLYLYSIVENGLKQSELNHFNLMYLITRYI